MAEVVRSNNSPIGDLDYKKPFAAGNAFSASAVYNKGPFDKETVGSLALKYGFQVLPEAEAVAAGYTQAQIDNAHVWYGPTCDDLNFYYFAGTFGGLPPQNNALFVARRIVDGSLVYARNCTDYRLDSSTNFMGNNFIFCRMAPAIFRDTIYVGLSAISNIGTQLIAINKIDGSRKWTIAYYTPPGAPPTITQPGNYDAFRGSNTRINDMNVIVRQGPEDPYPIIICGSSSFANLGLDVGSFVQGSWPLFTDQGQYVEIEDRGQGPDGPFRRKILSTVAPNLQTGDLVSKSNAPQFNPFFDGVDYTVVFTRTVDTGLVDPYQFVQNDPWIPFPAAPATNNSTPVSALVRWNQQTVIGPALFVQQVWDIPGLLIYENLDRSTGYTQAQLIDKWIAEQSAVPPPPPQTKQIWTFLTPQQQSAVTVTDNTNLAYYKVIRNNTVLANQYDANAINFWGASTWGPPPTLDGNTVYLGNGQFHSMPFFDLAYWSAPERNFKTLKEPLIAAQQGYLAGTVSLAQLNLTLDQFLERCRFLCVNGLRSPRGYLSYSNAILAIRRDGTYWDWAVRTLPNDNWGTVARSAVIVGYGNGVDGDVSSGTHPFRDNRRLVATANKAGIGITVDTTNRNSIPFNGTNLLQKGIFISQYEYLGTDNTWGGSNYQCAQDGKHRIYTCQANSAVDVPPAPPDSGERYITRQGEFFPPGKSYVNAWNVRNGRVKWVTSLRNRALSQIQIVNGVVFAVDSQGWLYGLNERNGKFLWQRDNSQSPLFPTFGGISTAAVTRQLMIWTPIYNLPPFLGQGSRWSFALHIDRKTLLKDCCNYDFLEDKCFNAVLRNATNPKIVLANIRFEWFKEHCDLRVRVTYTSNALPPVIYWAVFQLQIEENECDCDQELQAEEDRCPKAVFIRLQSSGPGVNGLNGLQVFSTASYTINVVLEGLGTENVLANQITCI